MLSAILIWAAKTAAEWAIGKLAKHLGYDNTVVHVQAILENAKPLPDDPNPSPASLRGPIEKF